MSWDWLDCTIVAVIGLSVITGLVRGLVKEIIALCVWILAIWLAFNYSSVVEPWFKPYLDDPKVLAIVSFVVVLLLTLIVGGLFNAMLSFILKRSGLSGTDRLLGMGFGFLRGVFIVALVILVVNMTSIPADEYSKQSKLYAKFDPLVGWMKGLMPELLKKVKGMDKQQTVLIDINPAP